MHIRKLIGMTALAGTMMFAQDAGQSNKNAPAKPAGDHAAHQSAGSDGPMVGPQDHKFMTEAARGGMMEVQLAQMAQQKASSDEVKDYARQLEKDHTKANEKLKAIAQERGVSLPTDLGPQQEMVTKLNALSGEEFDRQFMKMQVKDHKKDVKAFRKAVNNSMDTDLREFATATLPTLEGHLAKAQTLASQTGSRSRTK